jgi:hypothetical protein
MLFGRRDHRKTYQGEIAYRIVWEAISLMRCLETR